MITNSQLDSRKLIVEKIVKFGKTNNSFGENSQAIEHVIGEEIQVGGNESLLGHLRLCGAIPEQYGHDTSDEKLYSKYTDIVIHNVFVKIGFQSIVLKERADVADVECVCDKYSFVADAKAFRLSRTAKKSEGF